MCLVFLIIWYPLLNIVGVDITGQRSRWLGYSWFYNSRTIVTIEPFFSSQFIWYSSYMNLDEVHIIHLDMNMIFFLQWEQSITRRSYSGLWLGPCHWRFSRCSWTGCYIISFRVSFLWQVGPSDLSRSFPFQSELFNDFIFVLARDLVQNLIEVSLLHVI